MYLFPSKMAILIPAAVLFATVFTLNAMGRHSELTAVQGGGISFYRLIAPMLILATLAVPLDFELQELAGWSTTRQTSCIQLIKTSSAHRVEIGLCLCLAERLDLGFNEMSQKEGEASAHRAPRRAAPRRRRASAGRSSADSAIWDPKVATWSLQTAPSYSSRTARRARHLPVQTHAGRRRSPSRPAS